MNVFIMGLALIPATLALSGLPSEYHDLFGTGEKEWRYAFRGTAAIGHSVYNAYMDKYDKEVTEECKGINWKAECKTHYRNDDALDNWYKVKEVVFGVIKDGVMVKHIKFNGTETDKASWFDESKALDSCYSDFNRQPKNYFSMNGQGSAMRRFFINRNYDRCPNNAGWFVALDGDKRNCDWERNKGREPILLYAAGPTVTNWNAKTAQQADAFVIFIKYWPHGGSHMEYHDILNTGKKEWRLAFRGTAGAGYGTYPAYNLGKDIPETIEDGCKSIDFTAECKNHYRNDDAIDNWKPADIKEVLFGIVDDGAIVKYIVFKAKHTNKLNWFHQHRIIEQCWSAGDFKRFNIFGIAGHNNNRNVQRAFFINQNFGGCPKDTGYFVSVDNAAETGPKKPYCTWAYGDVTPTLYYSAGPSPVNWESKVDVKTADALLVFIKYEEPKDK